MYTRKCSYMYKPRISMAHHHPGNTIYLETKPQTSNSQTPTLETVNPIPKTLNQSPPNMNTPYTHETSNPNEPMLQVQSPACLADYS